MTNINLISNAMTFIIESVADDHTIEDIMNLDDATVMEFGEDYLFNPQDLREALFLYDELIKIATIELKPI